MGNQNPTTTGAGNDTTRGVVTGAIGTRVEQAGDYLEDKGKAPFISERLQSAGRYLQQNDVRSISNAVDSAICTHPYRSMLIGLGAGYLYARLRRW